jgi:hypothetical protein
MLKTAEFRIACLFAFLSLAAGLFYVSQLSDGLASTGDPFSESNALRAAHYYVDHGITDHAGLPDQCYGLVFSHEGFKKYFYYSYLMNTMQSKQRYQPLTSLELNKDTCVYTHYPQGPDLLAAAMIFIAGKEHTDIYRFLPLCFQFIGVFFLAYTCSCLFGPARCLAALTFCFMLPMFTNMSHGLHYQGYAFSLLLIEISFLILLFQGRLDRKRTFIAQTSLAVIGFIQGWMSFDYFFLVSLTPFAVLPILGTTGKAGLIQAIKFTILAGMGFCIAHLLHFLEVIIYFGSFDRAFEDFFLAATTRAESWKLGTRINRIDLLWTYLNGIASDSRNFLVSYTVIFLLVILCRLLLAPGVRFFSGHRYYVSQISVKRLVSAMGLSLMISCLWILIMKGHSQEHMRFIPRHLFLAYFIPVLGLLQASFIPVDRNKSDRESKSGAHA